MSLRTVVLLAVLAAFAVFAALNWSAFTTPTTLSLAFATVSAPLGIVMLVLTAVIAVLFLTYVVYLQSSVMLEARRNARELQTQRQLADEAEASRFTELRALIEVRSSTIESAIALAQSNLEARLNRATGELQLAVEQGAAGLSAHIGEMQDRLERNR